MHDIFTGDAELPSNLERSSNKRFAAVEAVYGANMARRVKASNVYGQVDPAQADRILAVRQDGTRYFEATASARPIIFSLKIVS